MNLSEFEQVVATALERVGRIWVNLNLRAVTAERRLLVLEYFLESHDDEFVRPPSHHISINPSGLIQDPDLRRYPSWLE